MNDAFPPEHPDNALNRLNSQADIEQAMSSALGDIPDFSEHVMAIFESERDNLPPCEYDLDFLSTYFDNELHQDFPDEALLTLRIQNFEKHLPQCPSCYEQLGQLFETRDHYRNYLYQLETALSDFDISQQVMQQLAALSLPAASLNEADPLPEAGCGYTTLETFSAYSDRALDKKTLSAFTVHLHQCEPCQSVALAFNTLQSLVQANYQRYLENTTAVETPDCWPGVETALQTASVIHLPAKQRLLSKKRWTPVATTVAASVLLFLAFGKVLPFQPHHAVANQPVDAQALKAAILADQRDEALRTTNNSQNGPTVNVIYESPEAYLFSKDADSLPLDTLNAPTTGPTSVALTQ